MNIEINAEAFILLIGLPALVVLVLLPRREGCPLMKIPAFIRPAFSATRSRTAFTAFLHSHL